jgi:hypothetical protein
MSYTHLTSICIRGRFNAGFELFSHGHSHLATHHHVGESVGGVRGGGWGALLPRAFLHRVHRVVTAFCRMFSHEGKIRPGC